MGNKRPPAGLAKWREQTRQGRKLSDRLGMRGRSAARVSEKLRINEKTSKELFGPIRRALRDDSEQQSAPKIKAKRKPGAGKKRMLSDENIAAGKKLYRGLLRKQPDWANAKEASAREVKEKLDLGVSWFTIKRHIVDPVLAERHAQRSRRAK